MAHEIYFDDESLTHQSFKDACDIRNIMSSYQPNGMCNHMTTAQAIFGDFSDVPDYREALDIINASQEAFQSLPAELRARFSNDPGAFLDFASNPENRDEMVKFGMIELPQTVQNEPKLDGVENAV